MDSTRSQTFTTRRVVSFSVVVLFMATAPTTSAQAMPDLFTRVETLTLSDGTPAVGSVSIGGDTAVVNGTGGVHVFEREPGGDHWAHSATLVGGAGTVATDGQTIVVTAEGAAHVFQRAPGTHVWQEAARLTGDQNPERFGASVAVSGTTVVVGAPFPKTFPEPQEGPGVVYIFERDEGGPDQWGEVARLVGPPAPPGPYGFDNFGLHVALDGDTLVVSRQTYNGAVWGIPRVHVFSRPDRDSNVWTQISTFPVFTPGGIEVSDGGVDISGNRIVASIIQGGWAAFLFEQGRSSDEWHEVARFPTDSFGARISGDLLVTTPFHQADVRVYARNQDGADQWGEVARGLNPPPSPGLGVEISAISGDTILAGGFRPATGPTPPTPPTFTDVEVYVADTDRDGLRDGRDPCPRDPQNNITGGCARDGSAYLVLDDLITLDDVATETVGDEFHITATFTNTGDTAIGNPFFEVIELSGANTLVNADGGRAGMGGTLSPDVGDGILSPGESTTVMFVIGLDTTEPFRFYVSVKGEPGQ